MAGPQPEGRTESEFDVVVIGSGPAAVAALRGLTDGPRVAVVTGAIPSSERSAHLHPKIRSVSLARAEPAGVAERVPATVKTSRPLFSTAAVGGLANYWGQQVVRWGRADPWPRDAFATYEDYDRACTRVESFFTVVGGETVDSELFGQGIDLSRPRLLTGSTADSGSGLYAMRQAFYSSVAISQCQVYHNRVHIVAPAGPLWSVMLDDGRRLTTRRILLAAGVLGSGQILRRSYPDITALQFVDHTPWMMFTLGASSHYRDLYPRERPFNALTAKHEASEGCKLFASFYDMRGAHLNLLLASTIGLTHPLLKDMLSPPGAGIATPVQVWTSKTYGNAILDIVDGRVQYDSTAGSAEEMDESLGTFKKQLRCAGIRILKTQRTTPGDGFHYHHLRLRDQSGMWSGIGDLLRRRTGGAVMCVDASTMSDIGCQPHTLTVMARALSKAESMARRLDT